MTTGAAIKDFTDLKVWQAARELRQEIYKLTRTMPAVEKFALANQLRRAAVSVTANIAEDFGRFSYHENIQFCRQARGSVYEVRDHLTTCADEGYLPATEAKRLDILYQQVLRILNGYVRSTLALKRSRDDSE